MGLLDASNFYILDVFIKKTSSMNYVKEKTSSIVLKNMKFSRFFFNYFMLALFDIFFFFASSIKLILLDILFELKVVNIYLIQKTCQVWF